LVGTNAYITPGSNSQGLAPHFDDIEGFVLQVEGSKKWKLYEPDKVKSEGEGGQVFHKLPGYSSLDIELERLPEVLMEVDMNEGDLLYMPRGTVHQAVTGAGKGHSTHLTVSTYQKYNWGFFMNELCSVVLDKCMDIDVEFRRGVPIGLRNMGKDPKVVGNVLELMDRVKEQFTSNAEELLDEAGNDFLGDFLSNRMPPPSEYFMEDKDEQTLGKKVRLRSLNWMKAVERGGGEYVLLNCLQNEKLTHMRRDEDDEDDSTQRSMFVDQDMCEMIKKLEKQWPEFVEVEELKLDEDGTELLEVLWEEGLVESKD